MPSPILACHMSFGPGATALILTILASWGVSALLILPNLILLLSLEMPTSGRKRHRTVFLAAILWTALCFIAPNNGIFLITAIGALGIPSLVIGQFWSLWRLRRKLRKEAPSEEPKEIYEGPHCVACKTPIMTGTGVCPTCGWTQPEYNRATS